MPYTVKIGNHASLGGLIDFIMNGHGFKRLLRDNDAFSPLVYEGEFGLGQHEFEYMIAEEIRKKLHIEVRVTVVLLSAVVL
jgi:hypothetical protein